MSDDTNHDEAMLLAQLKAGESNLARCYIAQRAEIERLNARLETAQSKLVEAVARLQYHTRGTTHWDGCSHPDCRTIASIEAFLSLKGLQEADTGVADKVNEAAKAVCE